MNNSSLEEEIINLLKDEKPNSVEQFVDDFIETRAVERKKVIQAIERLESEGKIILIPQFKAPGNTFEYIFSKEAAWFWLTTCVSFATFLSIILTQIQSIVFARQVLGFVSILFLPGFSLIKILFPEKKMDQFEISVLSIGLSLTLTPLIGMALNYTPWGLTTISVTISLVFITIVLALLGVFREYNFIKEA